MKILASTLTFAAVAACLSLGTQSFADITNVSMDGVESWDGQDDPSNVRFKIEVGEGQVLLTGIAWDVTITPVGASWYSEPTLAFSDTELGPVGVFLTVGIGDDFGDDGVPLPYDSGGTLFLEDALIPAIALTDTNSDGSNDVWVQVFEAFDDVADAVDARFGNGSAGTNPTGIGGLDITTIPEPAGCASLLLLGSVLVRRRK